MRPGKCSGCRGDWGSAFLLAPCQAGSSYRWTQKVGLPGRGGRTRPRQCQRCSNTGWGTASSFPPLPRSGPPTCLSNTCLERGRGGSERPASRQAAFALFVEGRGKGRSCPFLRYQHPLLARLAAAPSLVSSAWASQFHRVHASPAWVGRHSEGKPPCQLALSSCKPLNGPAVFGGGGGHRPERARGAPVPGGAVGGEAVPERRAPRHGHPTELDG